VQLIFTLSNKLKEAVMKKSIILIPGILLLSMCFCFQPLNGQEKTQAEKEKEAKLQQAIELQKKVMSEQKKEQESKVKMIMPVQIDTVRNFGRRSEYTDQVDNYRSRVRSSGNGWNSFDQPFVVSPGVEFNGMQYFGRGGDGERTTWDFSKQVKETTFSKSYSFDVEKTAGTVVMSVMGDCKAGEIRVKILMPGGKTYSDILIDEFGNLNWRKSFTISEEENKDKAGEWIFKIDASKATGYFKISLQTY
jgi:hypothetical protein